MRYRYLTAAESDQVEAATFYESQESGLGAEFIDEVDQTVQRILNQPYAGSPGKHQTRRYLVRRFPFSIVYRIDRDEILIVAIQHHSRNPRRWQDRISQ